MFRFTGIISAVRRTLQLLPLALRFFVKQPTLRRPGRSFATLSAPGALPFLSLANEG